MHLSTASWRLSLSKRLLTSFANLSARQWPIYACLVHGPPPRPSPAAPPSNNALPDEPLPNPPIKNYVEVPPIVLPDKLLGAQHVPMNDLSHPLRRPMTLRGQVFQPFFHFPYVLHVRAVSKLKFYQTILTSIAIPIVFGGYFTEASWASDNVVAYLMGANLIALSSLAILTRVFQRWIGRLYINEAGDKVLISHLTFFATRHDVIFPIEDIVPLDQVTESATSAYIKITRFSDPNDYYYLCLRYGGIFDYEAFVKVFGGTFLVEEPKAPPHRKWF